MRSFIQIIGQQIVPMKIDFGWINPKKMQQNSLEIRRLYRLVSSSVVVTSIEDHKKTLHARTRAKYSNELCFEDKAFLRGRQCNINNNNNNNNKHIYNK